MKGISPQVTKAILLCLVGAVLVYSINNWYKSTKADIPSKVIPNQRLPLKPPNGQNIPKGNTQVKK
jgi:hypothetical protein